MKETIISIIIAGALIGGAIVFAKERNTDVKTEIVNNVSMVDGKQVIEINAKGGYYPRTTLAKADIPTIIKVKTQGTFDCSSAISIPSIGYRSSLPASGITEVEVPPQKVGTKLQGLCTMGMYNFTIKFD